MHIEASAPRRRPSAHPLGHGMGGGGRRGMHRVGTYSASLWSRKRTTMCSPTVRENVSGFRAAWARLWRHRHAPCSSRRLRQHLVVVARVPVSPLFVRSCPSAGPTVRVLGGKGCRRHSTHHQDMLAQTRAGVSMLDDRLLKAGCCFGRTLALQASHATALNNLQRLGRDSPGPGCGNEIPFPEPRGVAFGAWNQECSRNLI